MELAAKLEPHSVGDKLLRWPEKTKNGHASSPLKCADLLTFPDIL